MPKNEDNSAVALKALLDKEFGPPKFAIQKQPTSPRKDSHDKTPSAESTSFSEYVANGSIQSLERPWINLDVVEGPAKGKCLRSSDGQLEVRGSIISWTSNEQLFNTEH